MEIRDNRDKEWFWLDNQYLNGYAKYLGMSCTVVYLSLCRHANNSTQQCFPSMGTIADQNGIGKRTVIRAIQKLEEWNIIRVEKSRKDDGTQANNIYTLLSKKEWKNKPSANMTPSENRVPKKTEPSDNKDISRVSPRHHNNTYINNTNINNTSNAEALQVSEVIKLFEPINITAKNWYGNTTQRKAVESLIEEIGFDRLISVVKLLPKTNKIQYITTVTTPHQLLNKFSDLEAQLTKLKLERQIIKNKIAFS
jgi:predicted transcriptional regulator